MICILYNVLENGRSALFCGADPFYLSLNFFSIYIPYIISIILMSCKNNSTIFKGV